MDKVISSNITRSFNKSNEELYELLKVVPVNPVPVEPLQSNTCDFQPRNDKLYIPKKKNRHKVNTVRDLRNLFEKDIMNELPAELEKQQNYILRKIKSGTIKDAKTISVAKNMLNSDKPLTRSTFQMLMNINPEGQTHSMQYVLWNGKPIRINGSKGGKNKFICKYDLGRSKDSFRKTSIIRRKNIDRKRGLLQNSLSVNFKPGPLKYKKFLDNSYQKYNVGNIDLVKLPKPGLEIQPLYGSTLEPTISSFVNKLRGDSGVITEKWAEFAVSVLGTFKGSNIVQINQGSSVTFGLNYNHEQTRLLMRRDLKNKCEIDIHKNCDEITNSKSVIGANVIQEVRVIMDGLLDAVEININQDKMYIDDDETREDGRIEPPQNNHKEKFKRRYCELDRLDVTVIRLTENDSETDAYNTCTNSFCSLGCICSSLRSKINLKGHCGRVDCMFECRCEFSKYSIDDGLCTDRPDLLPGLYNLNNEITGTLTKEEQKFHQTVILSGDKSILLKSRKRNCKLTKKYADFYNNLGLKPKLKAKPVLTIVEPKLNLDSVEPWCMVHNLYKCFCKGRFTEATFNETIQNETNETIVELTKEFSVKDNDDNVKKDDKEKDKYAQNSHRTRKQRDICYYDLESYDDDSNSCARVKPYEGRKYNEDYYLTAYNKIKEMEVNDNKLRKRLQSLINISTASCVNPAINLADNNGIESVAIHKDDNKIVSLSKTSDSDDILNKSKVTVTGQTSFEDSLSSRPKLVAWLESNYQEHKHREDTGTLKNTLEAPQKGKVALYPWDFILNRYSERKNLFLVSNQPPHRIFMAIKANNPLFRNCINIDDIRFADLNKYPITVKNLLTNKNTMKDHFCILYGYGYCWEFMGTVSKVNDLKDYSDDGNPQSNLDNQEVTSKHSNLLLNMEAEASITVSTAIQNMSRFSENSRKQSKWFIMTIENDFSEIQFYNRGFFVKYKGIVKAINVARMSGKTVRLSSQKCAFKNNDDTQFGIYAIPNTKEYCVFIGPYEIDESLGIETVKTSSSDIVSKKRTRGVWITTDKVDNLKVIDNPLSFIPSHGLQFNDLVSIESSNISNNDTEPTDTEVKKDVVENKTKLVKPIKISKSKGFYPSLNDLLNFPNQRGIVMPTTLVVKPNPSSASATVVSGISDTTSTENVCASDRPLVKCTSNVPALDRVQSRPVAEVAPQIKIAAVYSEYNPVKTIEQKRKEGGMFILKPEEINERLIIDSNKSPKAGSSRFSDNEDQTIALDIEHFLDTSTVCSAPETEIFVISDDDDEIPSTNDDEPKVIFIECINVENMGAIRGEMHHVKGVRFEFPGFKMSDYYKPNEVFAKINQVISRRVYIPKNLNLEWRIVDSMAQLKHQRLLHKEVFGPNLIMTKEGIVTKKSQKVSKFSNVRTYLNKNKKMIVHNEVLELSDNALGDQSSSVGSAHDFEEESQSLEEESHELFAETVTKKEYIMKSIAEASDVERQEYTSVLKDIETMSYMED